MDNLQPRSAGILMHISSLPSPFGIGDMGPEALYFADFLFRTQQTFWQILPLNPADESEGFSPYSSSSSMAGNIYLISPEMLQQENLLTASDVDLARITPTEKADFKNAVKIKETLLRKAYTTYLKNGAPEQKLTFNSFMEENDHWLRDFSYFILLKNLNDQKPWWEWEEEYKNRTPSTIATLESEHAGALHEIRWRQMIFDSQWRALKNNCAKLNVRIIGDMPFYVNQDSVDVWANKGLFTIDNNGSMTAVVGVPPDAFNDDGQLWGMPVYHWDKLKQEKFSWWITRLNKNLALFDIVRMDHFRAFASYWTVQPSEKNAVKGRWLKAPGKAFFTEVVRQLKVLPFIAEDLGEVAEDVSALRDEFHLPGMNVLQFAFGVNMPASTYISHHHVRNSVTYTGTHDNNTTKGWFGGLAEPDKHNLFHYLGVPVTKENVCGYLCRLAYSSVSTLTILPIQDILELDERARMNTPAGKGENWAWRLDKSLITPAIEQKLLLWCNVFDRRRDGDTSFATSAGVQ